MLFIKKINSAYLKNEIDLTGVVTSTIGATLIGLASLEVCIYLHDA